ncbi:unnamed protein product [Rotaria sordida]|uniref:N-acetylgalactosaminide beta-1,3-galactosyltransferase n=1 Tax=Rotaria sordida TaxID=392033 RepID=A0A814ENR9_9BILA|nr:unnamed protein product [Rotaria sordida]
MPLIRVCFFGINYFYKNHNQIISPRICCLILTTPKNFLTRAKAINETWAPRCDRYVFVTEYPREEMTAEQISFTEQIPIAPIKGIVPGYEHLTQKSVLAFLYAYENYLNDFDWFIKADDDTYLIIEHLKKFLSKQNSSEPITFGYNFKSIGSSLEGYQWTMINMYYRDEKSISCMYRQLRRLASTLCSNPASSATNIRILSEIDWITEAERYKMNP